MEVVFTHPNGWGIREQNFFRSAAVNAGFASIDAAGSKIQFVTEAEASVHYCIQYSNIGSMLQVRDYFVVV
jgi:hypothetical protein